MLKRWQHVFSVKITFGTNRFVSTRTNSMKCFVNWSSLRIRVRSRNTQPHLRGQPVRLQGGWHHSKVKSTKHLLNTFWIKAFESEVGNLLVMCTITQFIQQFDNHPVEINPIFITHFVFSYLIISYLIVSQLIVSHLIISQDFWDATKLPAEFYSYYS